MDDNKRRFQRIPFDAQITLSLESSPEKPITGILQDISLKGALIAVSESFKAIEVGKRGELVVRPDQGDIELKLTVDVAYALDERHAYGLNVISFDIESAAHLRRLVEVNLGNEESLQRELSNLINAMEAEHQP